jgi:hypothetical protein
MGFFNILETFFFISLAITFVLIIMLVYHFKGRLTNVENKYDTMFGIMHNMVGELKSIKKEIAMCALGSSACAPFMCMRTQSSNQTENNNDSNDSNDNHDEYDDEDSASESSEEYDNEPTYHSINEYDQSFIKIVVSDNEPELESVEPEPIEFSEPQIIELSSTEPETKVITIELSDNLEEIPEEIIEEEPHIIINKIDETQNENESDLVKKHDMVDYKKMDVSYLRTLVITRGLATDTKKLKKLELISLLEESDA